jgi:hypothetical protein
MEEALRWFSIIAGIIGSLVALAGYIYKSYDFVVKHRKRVSYKYNYEASVTMIQFERDRQQERWYYKMLGRSMTAREANALYAFKKKYDLHYSQIVAAIDCFELSSDDVTMRNPCWLKVQYVSGFVFSAIFLLLALAYTIILTLFLGSISMWSNNYVPYVYIGCFFWILPFCALYLNKAAFAAHDIIKKINSAQPRP